MSKIKKIKVLALLVFEIWVAEFFRFFHFSSFFTISPKFSNIEGSISQELIKLGVWLFFHFVSFVIYFKGKKKAKLYNILFSTEKKGLKTPIFRWKGGILPPCTPLEIWFRKNFMADLDLAIFNYIISSKC